MTSPSQNSSPTTTMSLKTAKFFTTGLLGSTMLLISGLTLTGTVLGLTATTPLFVLFSPVLVLALITTLMIIAGLLFSGGCGIVALVGIKRLYKFTRDRPIGCTDNTIRDKTKEIKDFVKEYVKVGQNKS